MPACLPPLVDTHCHLTHQRFRPDLPEVCVRAGQAGLIRLLDIGTGLAEARQALVLRAAHPDLLAVAAGLDPFTAHELGAAFPAALEELGSLARDEPIVAIGEFGLDYHHRQDPPPVQRQRAEAQLALAARLDRPAILHVREAHADMLALLAEHPQVRGVVHSFSGGPTEAERYLALGWHLSANGMVTYERNTLLREAFRLVPEDRLVLETDAPYLPPHPHRGQRCEPAHLALTAQALAQLRGCSLEGLAQVTTANAGRLFGWG